MSDTDTTPEGWGSLIETFQQGHLHGLIAGEILSALNEDKPITPERVRLLWDDEFLTNVIVPHLQHLLDHFQKQSEEQEPGSTEYGYSRWAVSVFDDAIYLLTEWRG